MRATINNNGVLLRLIMTADYTTTKDGLVIGAITGVDWDIKHPEASEASHSVLPPRPIDSVENDETPTSFPVDLNDPDVLNAMNALVDCPFAFRARSTSAGLMVSNMKLAASESICERAKLFNGMYAFSKDGNVPTPKPMIKTRIYFSGLTLPTGHYLQHYPQYFASDPNHPLPRELADMEDPEGAARRAGYPPIPKAVDGDEK